MYFTRRNRLHQFLFYVLHATSLLPKG